MFIIPDCPQCELGSQQPGSVCVRAFVLKIERHFGTVKYIIKLILIITFKLLGTDQGNLTLGVPMCYHTERANKFCAHIVNFIG